MHLRDDQRGFTLIELLLVVAILGVMAVPLSSAVIGILRNWDATSNRMIESHDVQVAATYFAQDVNSIGVRDFSKQDAPLKASIQLNASYNAGGYTCGTPATRTAAVRFLADDYSTASPPVAQTAIVAYYIETVGTERRLHRVRCDGAPAGSSSFTSDLVLVHNLDAGGLTPICYSGASTVACDGATVLDRVTLSFGVTKTVGSSYTVTLDGQRRQS